MSPTTLKSIHFDLLARDAVSLLAELIRRPSLSREENDCADFLENYLKEKGASPKRIGNNVWCEQPGFSPDKGTVLLNAHIDTVKPVAGWQRDPFTPTQEGDRLFGLGSNDCGGGLVSLLHVFLALRGEELPWNLIFLASAEEEVSGKNGIEKALPCLPKVDVAIVGEPTEMQPAVAEKGLMVLDCTAHGKAGHAARNEGVNAIYEALPDIHWFRTHLFPLQTDLLGPVKMSVTQIQAGSQHNVVPDACRFVVDVRSNECYSNQELLELIQREVRCDVEPRSTRLSSSRIELTHPLVQRAVALGGTPFGSPTLSDQALMPFPSFKYGPGSSSRSHTADEFICLSEIRDAVEKYCHLLMP